MNNSYSQSFSAHRGSASAQVPIDNMPGAVEGLDLRQVAFGIWRRKRMIFAVVAITMTACFIFLFMATPKYRSEARVLIEDRESAFTRATTDRASLAPDALAVQSEVQVVMSRDLALKVAEQLKLDETPEFNPLLKTVSPASDLLKIFGMKSKPSTEVTVRENMLDAYFGKLNVVPVPRSRVISISFSSTDAKRAAAVANTVASAYVNSTREAKYENTRRAAEWLARQIETLRQRAAESDGRVEEFRSKSGLFQGATTTLSKQALSELNSQITVAAGARSTAQARGDAIRRLLENQSSIDSAPEVLNSPLIQRLAEQRAILQRRIDERSIAYLPNHPVMQRLEAEQSGLDRQIMAEAVKILQGLESQAKSAGVREQALRNNLVAMQEKAALGSQDEVRLKALEREAAANRTLLQSFLNRFREASAREDVASLPAGARIISTAQVYSKPTFPRSGPIALLAFVASVVLGVVLAFLAEMISGPQQSAQPSNRHDAGSADEEQIEEEAYQQFDLDERTLVSPEVPDFPPLAVPDVSPFEAPAKFGRAFIEPVEPVSSASPAMHQATMPPAQVAPFESAIESLRERVVASCDRIDSNRILVTSTGLENDNAVVAVGLAQSLSAAGARVLLIDTDFHNACAAKLMNIDTGNGLAELLLGEASFKHVVANDPASNVQVVAAGHSLERGRGQLQSPRMERVMDALSRAYQYVILVAPSATISKDCQHVAGGAKLAVLLFDQSSGNAKATTDAAQTLLSCGCELVVPVETVFSASGLSIVPGDAVGRFGVAA